ncbi:MAG: aminoacyl-tRNA hydrolase, partial [Chloroflexi bacterium]|nr:aminoacyl-tRNA hydrolase [Chloroflexota bacterium]
MWLDRVRAWLRRKRRPSALDRFQQATAAQRRLIVGLGNAGARYADTRHNLGFRCVDRLAEEMAADWEDARPRADAFVAVGTFPEGVAVLLAKPRTFMNLSGHAVRDLVEATGLALHQVLVVYDDMDLPLGALRLRERGSPGTHNGMRSVVGELDSVAVPRLRIGIGQAGAHDARDYVLGGFRADEADLA